ncbi:MAG: cysteine desulfurase family protein [Thermoleophilia bacterium]
MKHIYLDYNATTPAAEEVVHEMLPCFRKRFGNPSSGHWYGKQAAEAVTEGRRKVASLLGCDPAEIVFKSGGSEANNYAIKGVASANHHRGNHIITSSVEHPAVTNPCRYLESNGFEVTWLPVDEFGMVNPEDVGNAINGKTVLITIMHANNEVGTIQPIAAIGDIAREHNIVFHTDAAQSVGKISTRVDDLKLDPMTVAGHKLYGPKGTGALYVRQGTVVDQLIHGAGHEGERRAGTENVPGIAGLGKACELAEYELSERITGLTELRDEFFGLMQEKVADIELNGHPEERLPNTLNVSFPGINAADLLGGTPEICASTGSACHDDLETVSPVLAAMGVEPERGLGAVRFSLGRWTTKEELQIAADLIGERLS